MHPSSDLCIAFSEEVCGNTEYIECGEYTPSSDREILFQYDPEAAEMLADEFLEKGAVSQVRLKGCPSQVESSDDPDVRLAMLVISSNQYNFEGLQIPVGSNWNTELLEQLLVGYDDREVVTFLKYGWPVDRDHTIPIPDTWCGNHRGALDFPETIDEFIQDGLENGYISGPYDVSPFGNDFVTSPLNTRSKRSTNQRRILMDLSWTMIKRIKKLGRGCLMFKRDLSKSFYQLPLCPSSYRLIGFIWRGKFYFKKVMPMGLTTACLAMQRTTLAIRYILNSMGYFLCPYVDDLGGCEKPDIAWRAYLSLGRVLRDVGARESPEKAVQPTTNMEFLGNNLNSRDLTISVTSSRLSELGQQLEEWHGRRHASRQQLESIIGKLQFCCNCVRSGRLFLNRLLNFLRQMKRGPRYRIPLQAHADLQWWRVYLPQFPSSSLMWFEQFQDPDAIVASDACLEGAGGVWFLGKQFYRCTFPDVIKEGANICYLELWAIILMLKIWHTDLKNKAVVINCDNMAVVELINSGRARDVQMQQGLREVCFLAATGHFELFASHISGKTNRIPDLLSRWTMGEQYRRQFRELNLGFNRRTVRRSLFEYSHPW